MTRIAVILHGSGARDGSEIHESTLTLLALDELGADVQCFAPFQFQAKVVNHLSGEETSETRSMQVEAARIARGKIKNLAELKAADFDGLVIPGGNGTAVNLCTFAKDGPQMKVHPEVERVITQFHEAQKPIGAICIAPVLLAKVLGPKHVRLTLGNDPEVTRAVSAMGAQHVETAVDGCIVDRDHKVVTTPAYMLAKSIKELWPGISQLCKEVLALSKS